MSNKTLRVLIVEDLEDDALLLIRELKKGGCDPVYERVETAAAMKKALKEKQWDIILCDYNMPKFNGSSAIAVLKESNIDIPVIIVSGTIGEETAVECMRLGAQDYIMKANLFRLCPAIARELEEAEVRSKQKQTEELLSASEVRYRRLFETAQDGILILDAETGQIADVNPFLIEMLGYAKEEFLGKKLWEIGV
jgi:DNA-binding NtrC family response regulator